MEPVRALTPVVIESFPEPVAAPTPEKVPSPAPAVTPPAVTPKITEIPLIPALPLGRFDAMVKNAKKLLQSFLVAPHAHTNGA